MIRAWKLMWKNTFSFSGVTPIKEYWLALLGNLIAHYVVLIPMALLLLLLAKVIGFAMNQSGVLLLSALCILIMNLPVPALLVRRIRDSGLSLLSGLYTLIALPFLGALIIGVLQRNKNPRPLPFTMKLGWTLLITGIGLTLWSAPLSAAASLAPAGLILATIGLVIGYISAEIEKKRSDSTEQE